MDLWLPKVWSTQLTRPLLVSANKGLPPAQPQLLALSLISGCSCQAWRNLFLSVVKSIFLPPWYYSVVKRWTNSQWRTAFENQEKTQYSSTGNIRTTQGSQRKCNFWNWRANSVAYAVNRKARQFQKLHFLWLLLSRSCNAFTLSLHQIYLPSSLILLCDQKTNQFTVDQNHVKSGKEFKKVCIEFLANHCLVMES